MGIEDIENLKPWHQMEVKGVVHCKKEPFDVYIGRPSDWGNPFVISNRDTRRVALLEYERFILGRTDLLNRLYELDGKILGCWCKPKDCHGDILAQLVTMVNPHNNKFYFDPTKYKWL